MEAKGRSGTAFLLNHWSEFVTRTNAFRFWYSRCQAIEKIKQICQIFDRFSHVGPQVTRAESLSFPSVDCGVWIWERKHEHYTQGYIFECKSNQKRSDVQLTMENPITMIKYQILTRPLIPTIVWFVSLSAPVRLCPCEKNGGTAKGGKGKNGR